MNGEFRMITDLTTAAPKELLFNYDELKAFLTEALQEYKTLVVTEDTIPDAKSKRAKLNKLAENLDNYRINVKKILLEKYDTDFAPKVNELKAMTKEASDSISEQIKSFERREAEAKIAEIKAVYDADEHTEAKEYLPWESILNPRWANKTYSIEDAKEEVRAAIFRAVPDVGSIKLMGEDNTAYLLDYYKQTRDFNAVVRKSLEIQAAKERLEEEKRRLEAQRQESLKRAAEVEKRLAEKEHTPDEESADDLVDEPEPVYCVSFRVSCTRSQLIELGNYMKSRGITYKKV